MRVTYPNTDEQQMAAETLGAKPLEVTGNALHYKVFSEAMAKELLELFPPDEERYGSLGPALGLGRISPLLLVAGGLALTWESRGVTLYMRGLRFVPEPQYRTNIGEGYWCLGAGPFGF